MLNNSTHKQILLGISAGLVTSSLLTSCTGQLPSSFRFFQQTQTFKTTQQVNTKIDLLWVVDNSSSMDVHQQKLRAGFNTFMLKYLQPTWDIRVAVITTDVYLANSAYTSYLATQLSIAPPGIVSSYLSGLSWLSSYQEPTWAPSLVNKSTGALTNGLHYGDLNPLWGPSYALLKPGIHDGPITAFCLEAMPYFLNGVTQCGTRDAPTSDTGADNCVSPKSGQSSLVQCVNTIENNTVRSGIAIISTIPPSGTPADSAWTAKIQKNFTINASVGSSGSGSERGLSSVLQVLTDNETTSTAFFRKNSLRGLIFLSDEDDQSLAIPSPLPTSFSPDWGYACDQASLITGNGYTSGNSAPITGPGKLCCSSGCRFGSISTSCPSKTVDSFTYTLGICADSSQLIPVSTIKSTLDTFFTTLDGTTSSGGSPNYFVASIVPTTGTSVQTIQSSRTSIDNGLGVVKVAEADRGDRYLLLGTLVGNGSLSLDISATDYSPVLDAIGQEIVSKMSTFTLTRAPTNSEEMIITIIHQDGTTTVVPSSAFTISGKMITFTSQSFVLGLASTDQVSINYQPKTAY